VSTTAPVSKVVASTRLRSVGGAAHEITLTTGQDGPVTVRGTLFHEDFHLVDALTGQEVPVRVDGDAATFTARAGHRYVMRASVA
jgi:alpha-L-fucosidase 2